MSEVPACRDHDLNRALATAGGEWDGMLRASHVWSGPAEGFYEGVWEWWQSYVSEGKCSRLSSGMDHDTWNTVLGILEVMWVWQLWVPWLGTSWSLSADVMWVLWDITTWAQRECYKWVHCTTWLESESEGGVKIFQVTSLSNLNIYSTLFSCQFSLVMDSSSCVWGWAWLGVLFPWLFS